MSLITRLSKFFSKPESKRQLGVSIGPSSLTLCYLDENNETSYQEAALDANQNLGDNAAIKNVTDGLTALLTKNSISGNCHVVLSPAYYKIVQVEKPNVPVDEMIGALKWQVNDLVTIAIDDLIIDYFDAPVFSAANPKVNVICASKSFLTLLIATINQDGIKLSTISTEEFAFISLVPKQESPILLVCQQLNAEAVLLIVKKGQLYFYRRLRGFTQLSQQSEQELAMGATESLSLEIQRSIDHFERQLKQSPIKLIQVIVPSAHEQYLVDKLAENTDIPVQLLALPEQNQGQRKHAVAIGAGLLEALEQSNE